MIDKTIYTHKALVHFPNYEEKDMSYTYLKLDNVSDLDNAKEFVQSNYDRLGEYHTHLYGAEVIEIHLNILDEDKIIPNFVPEDW